MELAFILKKLITKLVLPPVSLLLLALVGLAIGKRWPRMGRLIASVCVLFILALATPSVASLLIRSLDVAPPFNPASAKGAQAIVILGGGIRLGTPEYGDTPNRYTLDRVRYGAAVAKETRLPILVSGGVVIGGSAEAQVMANVLEREFAVPVRWREEKSLDTEDNLRFSAALLKSERIDKVILVTHDIHMLRALARCKSAGLICVPAPVSLWGRSRGNVWVNYLPDAGALEASSLALHEMLGYLALSLQ